MQKLSEMIRSAGTPTARSVSVASKIFSSVPGMDRKMLMPSSMMHEA